MDRYYGKADQFVRIPIGELTPNWQGKTERMKTQPPAPSVQDSLLIDCAMRTQCSELEAGTRLPIVCADCLRMRKGP